MIGRWLAILVVAATAATSISTAFAQTNKDAGSGAADSTASDTSPLPAGGAATAHTAALTSDGVLIGVGTAALLTAAILALDSGHGSATTTTGTH